VTSDDPQATPDNAPATSPAASDAPITVLAFSPTGQRLAVVHCDRDAQDKESGVIEVWRIDPAAGKSGRPAAELERAIATPAICANDVVMLDDNGRLAWAGATVTLENPGEQARPLARLLPDDDWPLHLAAATGRQWLAVITCPASNSDSSDTNAPSESSATRPDLLNCSSTLHIWAVGEEEPVALLGADANGVDIDGADTPIDITYLPAVSKLVALQGDGTAVWWSADIDEWQRQACALAGRNLTADEWIEAFPNDNLATGYAPVCAQFGVHLSVPETLVRQCDAEGLRAAGAIWQRESGLAARASAAGFDEWAAAVLIKHLLTDFPVDDSDPCLGLLAGLNLPGDTAVLQDNTRRVLALPAAEPRTLTFDGQAGDIVTLSFAPLRVAGDALLTILNERGTVLADNVNTGRELRLPLPADGTYRLEIEPLGDSPLVLSVRSRPPRALTLGETLEESDPEVTRWRFTGRAGQLVTLDLLAPTGDPTLTLHDVSDVQLRFDDDGGDGLNSRLTIFLPSNGLYTLDVGWIGEPQPYILATTTVNPAPLRSGDRPSDVPASRTMWQFDGRAGDLVTVDLTASLSGDASLILLDETGQTLARSDDRAEGNRDPLLAEFLPFDGHYYLQVEWLSVAPAERYDLTFDLAPAADLPLDGAAHDAGPGQQSWRFDGVPGSLVTLTLAASPELPALELFDSDNLRVAASGVGGTLTAVMSDDGPHTVRLFWPDDPAPHTLTATLISPETIDFGRPVSGLGPGRLLWRFEGRAGDVIRADLTVAVPGAWLRLLDSANVELATGVETTDFDLALETALRADGDYFLHILPGLNDPGNYTLTIERAEAPLLQGGLAVESDPEQSLWRYEGRAGDTITIDVTTLGELGDPVLRLFDDQGGQLAENDEFDGHNPRIVHTLPADGLYLIEVVPFSGTTPARYRILLVEE